MAARVLGVHPIPASEPVHLLEIDLGDMPAAFDWQGVTQEDPEIHRLSWQVAYDEQPVAEDGTKWAFFFHYLDLSKPLLTPSGPLLLPPESPLPVHLARIEYEEP